MTFEEYMKDKLDSPSGNSLGAEINEAILSLYKRGYIHVDMLDGEPMISITELGEEVSTNAIALIMPVAEA